MTYSDEGFREEYSDDPILDEPSNRKNKFGKILASVFLLAGSAFYIQSTLAANISISSGRGTEFGQGVSQVVTCAGSPEVINVAPNSSFANASNSGTFYLNKISVSGVPASCRGVDFTFKVYDQSTSTPLTLLGTGENSVIVQTFDTPGTSNDSATAWAGVEAVNVTSNATGSAFVIAINDPAALSFDVNKVTVETSKSTYLATAGGTVFYTSISSFNCGPTLTARCKYLEYAPNTWSGGVADPKIAYASVSNRTTAVPGVDREVSGVNNANSSAKIGRGFKDTEAIVAQNGACATPLVVANCTSGAAATRAYVKTYSGKNYSDWYLPNVAELNQLCKFLKDVPWTSDSTLCAISTSVVSKGFFIDYYSTTIEDSNSLNWVQSFSTGAQSNIRPKATADYVRPIRAF
jgi:hypothetical protein